MRDKCKICGCYGRDCSGEDGCEDLDMDLRHDPPKRRGAGMDDKATREEIINYLCQQPTMILATAMMYARNLHTSGASVVEKWENAIQMSNDLANAEKAGYMKAAEIAKDKCEHCEYKKIVLRQSEEEQHNEKDSPGGPDPDCGVREKDREGDDNRRGQMPAGSAPGSPEDREGLVRPEGRGVPGFSDQDRPVYWEQEESKNMTRCKYCNLCKELYDSPEENTRRETCSPEECERYADFLEGEETGWLMSE